MTKYFCPVCGKIEFKKGFQSDAGHKCGYCIHGDFLVMMLITTA